MQLVIPSVYPVPSSKATVTKLLSMGNPVPTIVRISPPRAFAEVGLTEETTNGIVMLFTPLE